MDGCKFALTRAIGRYFSMPLKAIDTGTSPLAQSQIRKRDGRLANWLRKRHVFTIVSALGLALIAVSERTYFSTQSSLERSIAITEARVGALQLFHLLTSAEAAQLGFLITGLPIYLEQFSEAQAALPKAQASAAELLGGDGETAAVNERIAKVADQRFAQISRTLAVARSGALGEALQMASADLQQADMQALRRDVQDKLSSATRLQLERRQSIFGSLMTGRIAVNVLTLLGLASLFLFRRQLQAQDKERLRQRTALLDERGQLERQVKRRTGQLTELTRHFQDTREEERALVAQQLHDDLGSVLTVSTMEIARARTKVGDPTEILLRLDRVSAHLKTGIALKRRIIEKLRPSALTHLGLGIALQNICDDTSATLGIAVRLVLGNFVLDSDAELAVYRLVQESLANVGQHAKAKRADVEVQLDETGQVIVEIRDDGEGFDTSVARPSGHGLASMRFRAESLGGSMRVKSALWSGTTVRIEFPQVQVEPSLF